MRAAQGNGVSKVQVFVGPRDTGSQLQGNATFTMPQSSIWSISAGLPSNQQGPTWVEAIATSASDGSTYIVASPQRRPART